MSWQSQQQAVWQQYQADRGLLIQRLLAAMPEWQQQCELSQGATLEPNPPQDPA